MEVATLKVQSLAALANTLLTSAQAAEVLGCLRGCIGPQLHKHNMLIWSDSTPQAPLGGDQRKIRIFINKLTVISMRPRGVPLAVISKNTTAYMEFSMRIMNKYLMAVMGSSLGRTRSKNDTHRG